MADELFNPISNKLRSLLDEIRSGKLGLPDLQRPFVWSNAKVRDLFDSMIKGYPIGYVMVWGSPDDFDDKKSAIGSGEKDFPSAKELIIDGQQRLTALVSAMYGVEIKDKDFKKRTIKIAYHPLMCRFDVCTPAIEKDAEWIPDISSAFLAHEGKKDKAFREGYLARLAGAREKKGLPPLTDEAEETVEAGIQRLLQLENYTMPTLDITSKADEEAVADIFVRVNSGGQSLNENDFILTLISVYHPALRDKIDRFCENCTIPGEHSSYNNIVRVTPSHIVRVAVGIGFNRARLLYAYKILRGKDLKTGVSSPEIRKKNFETFGAAVQQALDLTSWHAYLEILAEAGYVSDRLISSDNAVVFTYVLYLLARYRYKLDAHSTKQIIAKWFFMAAVTYYYSGSYESAVEKQLTDLREIETGQDFVRYLNTAIDARLTEDYFRITLPQELQTTGATSPVWYAYLAATNVLQYPMLFSTQLLAPHLMPGTSGRKASIEKHHIFPKSFLAQNGYPHDRDRNQIANYAYIDYATNELISDDDPVEYVEKLLTKLGREQYAKTCMQHALPVGFERMEYPDFLEKRRQLMAETIRAGYRRVCAL